MSSEPTAVELTDSDGYLTPSSSSAFVDYPGIKEKPGNKYKDMIACTELCPKCKGYGGWNLKLNAYRLPVGVENTPENRHTRSHFRAGCFHCLGWGWVTKEDAQHIHEWDKGKNVGKCLTLYTCTVTGCIRSREIDSSD